MRHDVVELFFGPARRAHAKEMNSAIEQIRASEARNFTIRDGRKMVVLTPEQATTIDALVCQGKEINFNGTVFVHRDGESATWRIVRGNLMIGDIITFEHSQITKLPQKLKLANIILTQLRQETQSHGWRACGIADDVAHPTMHCISATKVNNITEHAESFRDGLYVYTPTKHLRADVIMVHSVLTPAGTARLFSLLGCFSSFIICGESTEYAPGTLSHVAHNAEDIRHEIHTLVANPYELEPAKKYIFSVLFEALSVADKEQIRHDYPEFFESY